MGSFYFAAGQAALESGRIVPGHDPLFVALMSPTYRPDKVAHRHWGQVMGREATGYGYTAGGQPLEVTRSDIDDRGICRRFHARDALWPDSTIASSGAVIYRRDETPEASRLLGYVDFGRVESTARGSFRIAWDADGVARLYPGAFG